MPGVEEALGGHYTDDGYVSTTFDCERAGSWVDGGLRTAPVESSAHFSQGIDLQGLE